MTRTKLNLSNELNLITSIIVNDEAAKVFSDIDTKLLSTPYAKLVYGWARDYYKEYGKACRKDITELYKQNIASLNDSDEDNDAIKLFLKNLSDKYEDNGNSDFSIDQGHEYLKNRTEEIFLENLKNAKENGEDASAIISAYKPYSNNLTLPTIFNGSELITREFEPPNFIVPDFIASGVVMLVGAMKSGKSWMVLQLAANIASGKITLGKFKTNKNAVLYLALEDGPARLSERLKMLGIKNNISQLNIATDWRRGIDGLADLRVYIDSNPQVKMIIVDTLGCFRNAPKSRNIFQSEYDSIREFKKLAEEKKVCIMLIHHTRKPGINQNENIDVLDSINGSSGLGAACDSIMVLRRKRGGNLATLYCTSRDIEEKDWGLKWDLSNGGWNITGTAEEQSINEEQRAIISLLDDNRTVTLAAIAKAIHKDTINTNQILKRMIRDGFIKKVRYGEYSNVNE